MPISWTKKTEMAVLPSADGWTYGLTAPEATYCAVAGGILTINTIGGGTAESRYSIIPALNNATGYTIEFKMKVITSAAIDHRLSFDVFDGTYWERIGFTGAAVTLNTIGTTYAMDTTSAYHTYRIVVKGTLFKLFIDNILRLSGVLTMVSATNLIYFGDRQTLAGSNSQSEWDYVYYYILGAVPPEAAKTQYKVMIYDPLGGRVGILTSETDQKILNKFDFELNESGCGAFNMPLMKRPDFNIRKNDIIEIYLMNSTTPWYCGYVQKTPEDGRTEKVYNYSGYGLIAQMDEIVANKSYTTTEVSVAIINLLDTYITPKTSIIKNAAKIQATAYTVNSAVFTNTKAKKAIFDLTKEASGWIAGVDEFQEFFFKQRLTTIQVAAVKAIEKHVTSFLPNENISALANRLFVKGAEITAGSNYITTVEDIISQGKYGIKEDIITVPTTGNTADVTQWANRILTERKDPVITATISNIDVTFLGEKVTAEGKARIIIRAES